VKASFVENKMVRRSKKTQKSQASLDGYVVIAFAEDIEQAMEYKTLLDSNDVPTMVREQAEQSETSQEIAVMVPEEYIDEAHVIIESQQAYDDFCDFTLGDDSETDLDDDLYEEEY
jgi:hypothetical protein